MIRGITTVNRPTRDLRRRSMHRTHGAAGGRLASLQATNEMLRCQTANAHLITDGVDGVATVVGIRHTGASLHLAPVVQFDLLVMGEVPVPITHQEAVSTANLERVQVGASLRLRLDPSDVRRVWIDWNQWL